MSSIVRQESFAAGELDPSLHSAFSMAAYERGLKTCRNWIVSKYGTLLNRPGTRKLVAMRNSAIGRILPFDFSDDQGYMLALADGYLRVYGQDGTALSILTDSFTVLGLSSVYSRSTDGGVNWNGTVTGISGDVRAAVIKSDYSLAVAVGSSAWSSTDGGATWTNRASIPAGTYYALCWTGTRWVAVGAAGKFATSTDGITWTGGTIDATVDYSGVAANGATVIAVGNLAASDLTSYSSKSTDHGQTWAAKVQIDTHASYVCSTGHIVYTGAAWVTSVWRQGAPYFKGGDENVLTVWRSTDAGATWASAGSSTKATPLRPLQYTRYPTMFCSGSVVIGSGSYIGINAFRSVSDGTSPTFDTAGGGDGRMAMVVKSATVYYSLTVSGSNGWFYQSTDSGATWQNVAYGLVAGLGMIMATATVTEIAQPYAAADLPKLRAVQSGDVMVLTCRGYAPRKIVRGAASTPTVPAFSISNYMPTAPAALVTSVTISNADTVGDADHPLKAWDYVVTWEDADGVESLPSLAAGQMMTRHPDRPATITWTGVSGAVRYHVYAGRNGEYGYIGSSTTTTMYDDGSIPVMSYDPPKWENPFSTDYPAVSVFHEDRLAFANTPILPATVRWSATEEYYNFDESLVVKDEDSFKRTLAEMRYEEIRGLMLIGELLVFTSEGEWSITGDGAVSYRNLQATPQSHNGCSWVEPIRVNNEALYVQSGGKEIRNLYPSSDGWQSDEISVLVNHLFKGVTVVAWAFARRPYGIIWVVLSDGKLLSLTYDRKQEVWAWARHDTAGTDKFEWVSVLQYQGRDVPWFIVNRANTRYIEDMTDRHNITGTSFCGLDSAVYYYNVTPTNSISGLSHLEGRQVYGLASGTVRGPVTVSSGVANFGGATATTWWVGLQITADIETLDYAKSKLGQKAVAEVGIETSLEDISLSATAGVSMGEDLSHLDRVEFANARQGLLTLIPSTDLNPGARAAVRLTDPVPVEIRGITRVIAEGP